MSTVRLHFNALEFVKHSKELGVPELIAEYQAKQIEDQFHQIEKAFDQSNHVFDHVIEEKLSVRELATKQDVLKLEKDILKIENKIELTKTELQKEIAVSKNQVIIWISGIMSALLIASGLIQHFIK